MAEERRNKFAKLVFFCLSNSHFRGEIILEDHALVHVVSGELTVIQADRSYNLAGGDSLWLSRNQLCTMIKNPEAAKAYKSVVVSFKAQWLQKYFTINAIRPSIPHIENIQILGTHPLLSSYFSSLMPYFDLESQLPGKLADMKLEEGITILRELAPGIDTALADFSNPDRIDLSDFMIKNFMFNMPIAKFGYLTGRSLSTFRRDFKKVFQDTPQRWLTHKRLEMAHFLLSEKNKKPVEVYLQTGFENLSHFSFAFKKHFGYSPNTLFNHK